MILSTPHPPTSSPLPAGESGLFSVRPGIKAEDALVAAAEHLQCAVATAYEVADNQNAEFRPLARAVVHQLESAQLLVEASLAAVAREALS
ncbi:hypothetical protein RRX38_03740 [Pseudomonas sp. DTU_2021_1001937_2_SI_NGA_ILE_001]|uniref:DUF6124 family protein n=1 Tax=Pseudomonas sp. DTU_2021_1001937_2_SI_NGA_ILE_001 TaxID=3077589 RepID=UPI0028FC2AA9|nr:hypothetical protein [Pseudomonas sp. DTU_2021_1001937_2_SI_NGA_ILE_001]WNW10300.1 hypothetical protein RRX38_03740 [Pseudomonas sp. DTU_2021_1001937_2_SI_NGA_ILE_001]